MDEDKSNNNEDNKEQIDTDGSDEASTPSTPAESQADSSPTDQPSGVAGNESLSQASSQKKLWWVLGVVVAASIVAVIGLTMLLVNNDDDDETDVVKRDVPLLRVSLPDSPVNLFFTNLTNDGATAVNAQIYEGLVAYDDVTQFAPRLATSWTNPDDETWVFSLKEGVTFHNGSEMTADDVKFSFDNGDAVGTGGFNSTIASTEVVDDYTVRITTDGPDPLLLSKLAFLWVTDDATDVAELASDEETTDGLEEAAEEATDETDGEFTAPSGTGPFTVKSGTIPSASDVELAAFADYHGGEVYTKEVHFMQMENADAVAAFNNGEVDIASTLTTDYEDLNLPDQRLLEVGSFNVNFLGINSTDEESPLADLDVRKAIAMTVDPAAVIEAQGVEGQPVNQFITRDIPGYNPNLERWPLDAEAAESLMADAGYADGFTVELSYASDDNVGMFESIQEQLAQIDITVTEDAFGDDFGGLIGKLLGAETELFFIGWQPEVLDATDPYNNLFTSEGPIYQNSAVDDLLDQASAEIDEQARLELLYDIAEILHENVASVPLYSRNEVTAVAGEYVVEREMPAVGSGFYYHTVYLP